jgi:ring-1,2-phenylacetyl-CoA epoxidase subunit PaaC
VTAANPASTTVLDRTGLSAFVLRHGDDNLVLAQRLSMWVSRAPDLEEDLALGNVALDHLGAARALLTYAGELEGEGRGEDQLAMGRSERQYTNLLMVEQPNGDFAMTVARQFLFDAYQLELWEALAASADETLAGLSARAWKEARYHVLHSSTWVERLGDGTDESHRRVQSAFDWLWQFTDEMFEDDPLAAQAAEMLGIQPLAGRRDNWDSRVDRTLETATLVRPAPGNQRTGGRRGRHTEHLGHLLAEMQWMQRSYPGLEW